MLKPTLALLCLAHLCLAVDRCKLSFSDGQSDNAEGSNRVATVFYYDSETDDCTQGMVYGEVDLNAEPYLNRFASYEECSDVCVRTGPCGKEKKLEEFKQRERTAAAGGAIMVGAFIPQCDDFGYYTPAQNHGSTGYTWCVQPHTGEKVDGTDTPPAEAENAPDCDEMTVGPCEEHVHRFGGNPPPGAFVPACDDLGFYQPKQFHGSIGTSFCVHRATGARIEGTGDSEFDCENEGVAECDPETEAWTSCGTACPPTCGRPPSPICTMNCVIGCQCKAGFMFDEKTAKCVKPNECSGRDGDMPGKCAQEVQGLNEKHGEMGPPPGAFVPQCDDNGDYAATQFHGSTGYSWCVHAKTGAKVEGTDTAPGSGGQPDCGNATQPSGKCAEHLTRLNEEHGEMGPPPGAYVPQCDENGDYNPKQSHGSTGYEWCADPTSGVRLPGTEVPSGRGQAPPPVCGANVPQGKCAQHLTRLNEEHGERGPPPGAFVPECDENGDYQPAQFHGSTGHAWCVDTKTGVEIDGTLTPPGAGGPPDCDKAGGAQPRERAAVIESPAELGTVGKPVQAGVCAEEVSKILASFGEDDPPPGTAVPVCDDNGDYLLVQTHGSTGYSWCVDTKTGRKIEGTEKGPTEGMPLCPGMAPPPLEPVCDNSTEHYDLCNSHCVPTCLNPEGPQICTLQCAGGCVCNDGLVRDDKSGLCVNVTDCPPLTQCQEEQRDALAAAREAGPGAFVPSCDQNGDYRVLQRHPSTGHSWCVDADTGAEVNGTRRGPGEERLEECAPAALGQSIDSDPLLADKSDVGCPPLEHFATCGSPCADTCAQPNRTMGPCTRNCFIGCQCDEGLVRDEKNQRCVPLEDCDEQNECAKHVARMAGIPLDDETELYRPQCDEIGLYRRSQKHSASGFTWCVDPETGVEIEHTRRAPDQPRAKCASDVEREFEETLPEELEYIHISVPSCDEPLSYGSACNDSSVEPRSMWHFDPYRHMCVSFTYSGCGELNGNAYDTKDRCQDCFPSDGGCSGGSQLGDYSSPIVNETLFDDEHPYPLCGKNTFCPDGYNCLQGMVPMCCNQTVDGRWALYDAAYDKKCANGQATYTFFNGQYDDYLIGISCDTTKGGLTCPDGYECQKVNHLFAKCCQVAGGGNDTAAAVQNDSAAAAGGDVDEQVDQTAGRLFRALMKRFKLL